MHRASAQETARARCGRPTSLLSAAVRAELSLQRALDPVLPHVARAPVYLKALVHQLERRTLRQQLGHRDLADRLLAGDEAPQRVVGHAAAAIRRRGQVDELVADRLVARERAPER